MPLSSCAKPVSEPLVGRFAPSPTGRMHAGNIFASLIAWLVAKQTGGKIILRIEDLDTARSKPAFADLIMKDYEMLGLLWDAGPYFQSSRIPLYQDALRTLKNMGITYPCYCSRANIHAAAAPHEGDVVVYSGKCRNLSATERARIEGVGKKPAVRIIVPEEYVSFNDCFQGNCTSLLSAECGDFIIQRSDKTFAYQLAVVVDDAEMKINSVVRGCDLLQSTSQQIFLQHKLGLPTPNYGHIALITTAQGRRIAKREKDASLDVLLEKHKTPEGVLGHIAALAGIVDSEQPYSAEELREIANLDMLKNRTDIVWN